MRGFNIEFFNDDNGYKENFSKNGIAFLGVVWYNVSMRNKSRISRVNRNLGVYNMGIRKVTDNKKRYISLLLLADEQEDMIDRYLETGTMYVLDDSGVKAECVVTDEGNGILEIKNIAVHPEFQGKGYGKKLINFIMDFYSDDFNILQVGTGDSQLTIPFYEKCGFKRHHKIKNFFIDNYNHPIFECGVQLIDMIYLQAKI